MTLKELDIVQLKTPIKGNRKVHPGATGTVLDCGPDDWYVVEFTRGNKVLGLVDVKDEHLVLLWRDGKWVSSEAKKAAGL